MNEILPDHEITRLEINNTGGDGRAKDIKRLIVSHRAQADEIKALQKKTIAIKSRRK